MFGFGVGGKWLYEGVPGNGDAGENGMYGDPVVAPVGMLVSKLGESMAPAFGANESCAGILGDIGGASPEGAPGELGYAIPAIDGENASITGVFT